MEHKRVSIVLSLYNEEANLEKLFKELSKVEATLADQVKIEYLCVNDGSEDGTLETLIRLSQTYPNIRIYNLFRNFGHEIAMSAGMDQATGDCILFMDGDLQHPPELIEPMVLSWLEGHEVVLTRKITRDQEKSRLYSLLSRAHFALLNALSDIKIPRDFPDFRLLDRKQIETLKQFDEKDRMFRGLLNFIGYHNAKVIDFEVPPRYAGETKYTFRRSAQLVVDSLLQFSTKPLRLATYLGLVSVSITTVIGLMTLIEYLFFNTERSGYATTLLVIIFMGSIQLIVLGIIGEYIGKIHMEVKKRPLYFGEWVEPDRSRG